jgi:hypothetical protein
MAYVLNTKLGDIASEIPVLSRFSKLDGLVEAIKDIPVVDIAAAGVAGAFQYRDDVDKGWSSTHAAIADFGSAALGVGAAATTMGLLKMPSLEGALISGAVGFGVGDIAYQACQENWDEDIGQHGVVKGIGIGIGNVGENTAKDVVHMAEGIGDSAKSFAVGAWHDLANVGGGIGETAKKVWDDIF